MLHTCDAEQDAFHERNGRAGSTLPTLIPSNRVMKSTLVCLAIAFTAVAQAKPDFSGKWKLNIDESEFPGGAKPPAATSAIRTVQHAPTALRLKIERVTNGQKSGFDFVTIPIGTGEPHISNEAGIVTAEWNGETLHFDYLYNPGTDRESARTEDWTLSADGKKLIDREWGRQVGGREVRSSLVFDRQP
jgi:hypothetical protein